MITGVKISTVLCIFLVYLTLPSLRAEQHSLYYIYTALSKPVNLTGIYQFTAMGLLDGRLIDYYNNVEQKKIPKQTWMKEKIYTNYWEEGTQSRKRKEQWFNENINILIKRMGHNESHPHVLQWRTGCEIKLQGNEVTSINGFNEYAYDGEDFLSFDIKESQWVASVDAALPTKRKWDNMPILTQHTKGYLEKECVDWLNKFSEYADKELEKVASTNVSTFVSNCTNDKTKLKLNCMATNFYYKDIMLTIRKENKSLAENEIKSTQIRPNINGSFQIMKSVEINEDEEEADYDCFVSHRSFKEPIINKWERKCQVCPSIVAKVLIYAAVGGIVMLIPVGVVCLILHRKKTIVFRKQPEKPVKEDGHHVTGISRQFFRHRKVRKVSKAHWTKSKNVCEDSGCNRPTAEPTEEQSPPQQVNADEKSGKDL